MSRKLLVAIIILPGNVLIIIPGILLWLTNGTPFAAQLTLPEQVFFWAGLIMVATGLGLAVWRAHLFLTHCQGIPAPWGCRRNWYFWDSTGMSDIRWSVVHCLY